MKLRQLVLEKAIVTGMKSPKRDECIGELLDATRACDFFAAQSRGQTGTAFGGYGRFIFHFEPRAVSKIFAPSQDRGRCRHAA